MSAIATSQRSASFSRGLGYRDTDTNFEFKLNFAELVFDTE